MRHRFYITYEYKLDDVLYQDADFQTIEGELPDIEGFVFSTKVVKHLDKLVVLNCIETKLVAK